MTQEQIMELFIQAVEVDRRLPQTAKPKALKAMSLPYVHDTADQNGWGAERYLEERAEFFDARSTRLTKNQIGIWEAAMEAIKLCENESQRRSLWAWATAQAGGMPLSKWSKTVEHIHPATAEWRAKRAIRVIHNQIESKRCLHNQNDMNGDLSDTPKIMDNRDKIRAWRDTDTEGLMPCYFDQQIAGISVKELALAKRRERDAKRRQSEAA
ncbi:hypothetical protein ASD54_12365 [Rhizobium sp. Root149]|uniref:hypothetical protein n=1 Tax=Rhizobium sp. Root149 TaxID=1736473 RepID=UPI000715286D|nr:hypothetical protein [Rhizobium sp. Root149]KQZ49725.1 hypothetical protein ASD54_12365 [Rhizobium sp. Root149]